MAKNEGQAGIPVVATGAQESIPVEVAYALPERQRLIALQVRKGCTALEAVRLSGIAREFPDIVVDTAAMGIFAKPLDGKVLPLPGDYQLKPRDRVEIYRPLLMDPKQARLARAARAKEGKSGSSKDRRGDGIDDSND